tara:strand:+ start:399 stop:875 length:477 start_codon:yes stop_codon:yes gene_type:complete
VSLSIKELNYDNLNDLRKLESALKNWFADPKELNFTDSEMRYPFDMKKWININYRINKIKNVVLTKDDWIIGYGGVKFVEKDSKAHITQIFLDPEYRGNGYRNKIIEHLEDLASTNKAKTLTINAMKKDISSRRVFQTLGYNEIKNSGNIIFFEKLMK